MTVSLYPQYTLSIYLFHCVYYLYFKLYVYLFVCVIQRFELFQRKALYKYVSIEEILT